MIPSSLSDDDGSEIEDETNSDSRAVCSSLHPPSPVSPRRSRLSLGVSDTQSVHSTSARSVHSLNVYHHQSVSPRCSSASDRFSPRSSCSPTGVRPLSVAFLPSQPYSDSESNIDWEEEERRSLLQLYVLVARCIAYPFANKQNDTVGGTRNCVRATEPSLIELRKRFEAFLDGRTRLGGTVDEAMQEAMGIYHESVLINPDVAALVKAGGWMVDDFTSVFQAMLPRLLAKLKPNEDAEKRIKRVWLQKFDMLLRGETEIVCQDPNSSRLPTSSEMQLTTEQLYDVFQGVLGVKRFEHQILYKECQLGNRDEQAALLRRELRHREETSRTMQPEPLEPLFTKPEMATLCIKEVRTTVKHLFRLLDAVPVNSTSKTGTLGRVLRSPLTLSRHLETDSSASKSDIVMPFRVEVLVMQARGLNTVKFVSPNSIVYAVMKVDGSSDMMMTNRLEAKYPLWETEGDFSTTVPRPHVRIDLLVEDNSYTSFSGEKRIGKLILQPTSAQPVPLGWYKVESSDTKDAEVKVQVKMDIPDSMKKFGFVYVKGTHCWTNLKCRYLVLVQMTGRLFALCSYEERQNSPKRMIVVEGYRVDYCEPYYYLEDTGDSEKYMYQFVVEKDGDRIIFGCQEEREQQSWVMALCRATGQKHRPEPVLKRSSDNGDCCIHTQSVSQRIGLDAFLQTDVSTFDHNALFEKLQVMTLDYRLSEGTGNLGWFSPGQKFVLDEYCSRYNVRQAHRYLCWLEEQLQRAWQGTMIDPGLVHYCYTWIEAHILGLKPDSCTGSILVEEKQRFENLREDLHSILLRNLRNFPSCFPFGCPNNALKFTLSLLERLIVTDQSCEHPLESLRSQIQSCMRTAALKCYNIISLKAANKLGEKMVQEQVHGGEGSGHEGEEDLVLIDIDVHSVDYIVVLVHLAIELCNEIEDFHGLSFERFQYGLKCCIETVWDLFYADMKAAVDEQPHFDLDVFRVFYCFNDFLSRHGILHNGKCHKQLLELFMPRVIDYISHVEVKVVFVINHDLAAEKWEPEGGRTSVKALENMFQKLDCVQTLISNLEWPEPDFRKHLEIRISRLAADTIESFGKRTQVLFNACCEKSVGSGRGFHFIIAAQPCVMLNVICMLQHRVNDFCAPPDSCKQVAYREDIGDVLAEIKTNMTAKLIMKLTVNLEHLLSQLARYDTEWLPFFVRSLTAPKLEVITTFVQCISQNLTEIDSLLFVDRQQFMLAWHNVMCKKILDFVNKRPEALVEQQVSFISELIEQQLQCFLKYGFSEEDLKSQSYNKVLDRIRYEVSAELLLRANIDGDS